MWYLQYEFYNSNVKRKNVRSIKPKRIPDRVMNEMRKYLYRSS